MPDWFIPKIRKFNEISKTHPAIIIKTNLKAFYSQQKKCFLGYCTFYFKLFMVTGGIGIGGFGDSFLDSTEIFKENVWTEVGKLPVGIGVIKGATIDNRVLIFGKQALLHCCIEGLQSFQTTSFLF